MDKKKRFCLELYYVLSTPLYSDDHLSPYLALYTIQDGLPVVGLPQSAPPLNQSHLSPDLHHRLLKVIITGFARIYYLA